LDRNKKRKNSRKKAAPGILSNRNIIIAAALIAVLVIAGAVVGLTHKPSSAVVRYETLRCAVVDQLSSMYANPEFITEAVSILEDYGFEADVYHGDEVTVGFWETLPQLGYSLIVLREHASMREDQPDGKKLWMFTSEEYSRMRYYLAQIRDQVAGSKAHLDAETVFSISSRYITDCMEGNFDNTVIVNMGCAAFYNEELADVFMDRGASAYIGWNASVGLQYVDNASLTLIKNLCNPEYTLKEAVNATISREGDDPNTGAELKYYPEESSGMKISELMKK
jgi:hypothetical protein